LEELLKQAELQIRKSKERETLAKIKATKPTNHDALIVYFSELTKLDPSNKAYADGWRKQRAALDKIEKDARTKAAVADRAKRRREGVSIGMTKEEVLMSQWGRPEKINRSTTARGTTEQWVYGGGYLYFGEDGLLRAIQN
jgi:hypothetical protein